MSDDLWRDAMQMWMDDDYDPLDDSDEDFVEVTMNYIPDGAVLLLKADPVLPLFFTSQWGTTWTRVKADTAIIDRCTFCGRRFTKEKVFTNKESYLFLCPQCVYIEG